MPVQSRIHPVTNPSGVLAVVQGIDDLHDTVMASLPNATGCNVAFTRKGADKRPVFEITASFVNREDADFAVRLVNSGSVAVMRRGFTAAHSLKTGCMSHRVVISQITS